MKTSKLFAMFIALSFAVQANAFVGSALGFAGRVFTQIAASSIVKQITSETGKKVTETLGIASFFGGSFWAGTVIGTNIAKAIEGSTAPITKSTKETIVISVKQYMFEAAKSAVLAHPYIAGAIAVATVAGTAGIYRKLAGKSVKPVVQPVAPIAPKAVKINKMDKFRGTVTKFVTAVEKFAADENATEFGSDITSNKLFSSFTTQLNDIKYHKQGCTPAKRGTQAYRINKSVINNLVASIKASL